MPSINDNDVLLWRQIAASWYDVGIHFGLSGLNPPSVNDIKTTLMKKVAYYTARIAAS